MIEINTVNVQRFSFNGIEYFKNFLSKVSGNLITIYNAYDERDVRLPYENYTNVKVNGVTFNNVAALQSALLDVIYTRDSLGGTVYIGDNFNRITIDKGFSIGVNSSIIINKDSEWLIKGLNYKNTSEVFIQVPPVPTGKKRIDYIVVNQNNTFERISGIEVNENQAAIAPQIPENKLAYTFLTINNTGIVDTSPINQDFVKIQERLSFNHDSSANFVTLNDTRKFINLINDSQTTLNYILYGNEFVSGQNHPLIIRNSSATQKTISHLYFSSNTLISNGQDFYFPNTQSFVLKSNESVEFIYNANSNRYEYLGIISSDSGKQNTLVAGSNIGIDNTNPLAPVIRAKGVVNVYNVKEYGALGNGTTDDTAKIQDAINACASAGGGCVYFPNGVYIIAGALVTSDNLGANPNSQLYIPAADSNSVNKTAITFLGETEPNYTPSAFTATFTPTLKGVVLLSTLTTVSGVNPSVFGTKHPTSFMNINYTNVTFENITVLVNKDPFGFGPVIGGMNMANTSTSIFNKVVVNINGSMTTNTNLPTAEIAGIVVSKTNAEFNSAVRNTIVTGFRYGIVVGEHCIFDQSAANGCWAGYVFLAAGHSIGCLRMFSGWCKYVLYFPPTALFGMPAGDCRLILPNVGCEIWIAGTGKWNDSTSIIFDPSNFAIGSATIHVVGAGTGIRPLTKTGGKRFVTASLERPLSYSENNFSLGTDTPATFISQNISTGVVSNIRASVDYARYLAQGEKGAILALADYGTSSVNSKRFEIRANANKGTIEGVNDAGTALTFMFMDFDLVSGKVTFPSSSIALLTADATGKVPVTKEYLQSIILSGSATLDFPSTEPGNSSELTFSVTGASEGDCIALGTPNIATTEDTCFTARVSAANTVTVKLNNYSAVTVNPPSALFKVKILK